jgi:hypothetical protein
MKTLFLILAILFSTNLIAEDAVFIDSLEDAVSFAEDQDKELLVVFSADWCKNCIVMKKDIKSNLNWMENKVICYVDIDTRTDLREQYKVRLIPDYFILKNKIESKRRIGYDRKSFLEWLKK